MAAAGAIAHFVEIRRRIWCNARIRQLDRIDIGIIEALQRNGRESFRSIAGGLAVAEATVRGRYARLVADDVLHVVGITNPLALGFEAEALVGVRTSGEPGVVAGAVAEWPEASYVVVAAGRFDVLVELVCADRRHLLELTNRLRALDGVVTTETFTYLHLTKQTYTWGTRV